MTLYVGVLGSAVVLDEDSGFVAYAARCAEYPSLTLRVGIAHASGWDCLRFGLGLLALRVGIEEGLA